ncbi:Rrf2 family transcriptional regulator [Sutterella sp.]|uniref:Rrf2 family transcriptional regulator n=1 Tax=Sutterella sp. TaxID=1981025 RepID=UPI0026DEE20C|nr:Rrf2 family transcriptional regulator [Sutterella sp.]MDO5530509.1 Rrf2 family transcriptional regulator [Sutterella sp.]
MKLTTKGRFAVTAMVDLAMRAEECGSPIPIAQIAERQKISLTYLEQIFCRLRRAGLVESTRGPGGGYRLAEPAESITIDRIIIAVDENMDTTQCGGEGTCQGGASCLTHHLWEDLNNVIERFLAGVSLASLVAEAAHHHHGTETVIPAVIPVKNSAASDRGKVA